MAETIHLLVARYSCCKNPFLNFAPKFDKINVNKDENVNLFINYAEVAIDSRLAL